MCALLTLSEEMVNVIFERGKFDHNSTIMTAKALQWYAMGLPFYSLYKIFVPVFYAIDRQKIPVIVSVIAVLGNIAFCTWLTPIAGFEILAIGTSLSMFFNACVQGFILKSDIDFSWKTYFNLRVLRVCIAFVGSFYAVNYAKEYFLFSSLAFIERCFVLGFYLTIIASSYFLICVLLGERAAINKLVSRFRKRK